MNGIGYGAIIAAGPFFFLSAWILMVFTGTLADEVGIQAFGYVDSMRVTIVMWLVVAPLLGEKFLLNH